ncbi:Putative trans-acting enoyl reductase [Burkholderiales bacterium]|nr:Putative trans-acting enoyl reductase [Burkholderiales bacterium]
MADVLIYGATGYMGKLCARELLRVNIRPILAGRGPAVRDLARRLDCEHAVFDLRDANGVAGHLKGVALVINLAGPFKQTQIPLVRACLAAGCHYIDIAGEVDEMQSVHAFDDAARQAGIMLMPGAGFGVVPTDIAARMAQALLPNASALTILL